jgi:hypothetical protein
MSDVAKEATKAPVIVDPKNFSIVGYDIKLIDKVEELLDELPISAYERVKKIKALLSAGIPIRLNTGEVKETSED